jgi:hypothetical protein
MKTGVMRGAAVVAAALWIGTSGCATTRYMGPLDAGRADGPVTDASPPNYPSILPKIVAVTPTDVVMAYPGGARQLLPKNSSYVQVETSYGIGALEGFLGGAAIGLAAGAAGSTGCSSDSCTGAALALTALITGAFGALYGVVVGQTTTYVFAPTRP